MNSSSDPRAAWPRRVRRALLAASLALAGAAPAQTAAPETVRPVIATPLNAGVDLLRAGKFQEALAKAAEAEAVPERTPYENFVLDQLRAAAATGAGDHALAVRSYEAVLAAGRLDKAEALKIMEGLAGTSYRLKDYARSVTWARRYLADGGGNAQVRRLLANALLQQSDWPAAAAELKTLVESSEAAGQVPPEDLLRLLGNSYGRMNNDVGEAGYTATLERLLRHHPKPDYWRDRIGRLQTQAGFDDALLIDSHRLLRATGAMQRAGEYILLSELALRAGLPAEAQQVLDAGFAAGVLGSGADAAAHTELRERATRLAAADAKSLGETPDPAAGGDALVTLGLAQATAGRAERGVALIEQGLAKGDVKRPELARLRLAWIAAGAGQRAKSDETLVALERAPAGVGDLARLWRLHLARAAR